jgi:hypothetical protein
MDFRFKLVIFIVVVALIRPLLRLLLRMLFRCGLVWIGKRALAKQPEAIHLTPRAAHKWMDAAAVEAFAAPLVAHGFQEAGTYGVEEMAGVVVRFLIRPDQGVAACIYEHPQAKTWIDLVSRYRDGTSVTFTTLRPTGMDSQPGHRKVYATELTSDALYQRLLQERPAGDLEEWTAANVVQKFEDAYARERRGSPRLRSPGRWRRWRLPGRARLPIDAGKRAPAGPGGLISLTQPRLDASPELVRLADRNSVAAEPENTTPLKPVQLGRHRGPGRADHLGEIFLCQAQADLDAVGALPTVSLCQCEQGAGDATGYIEADRILELLGDTPDHARQSAHYLPSHGRLPFHEGVERLPSDRHGFCPSQGHGGGGAGFAVNKGHLPQALSRAEHVKDRLPSTRSVAHGLHRSGLKEEEGIPYVPLMEEDFPRLEHPHPAAGRKLPPLFLAQRGEERHLCQKPGKVASAVGITAEHGRDTGAALPL